MRQNSVTDYLLSVDAAAYTEAKKEENDWEAAARVTQK